MSLVFVLMLLVIGMPLAYAKTIENEMTVVNEPKVEEPKEEPKKKSSGGSKGGGGRTSIGPATSSDESKKTREKFSNAPTVTRSILSGWAKNPDSDHRQFFAAMSILHNSFLIEKVHSIEKTVPQWVKNPVKWWSVGLITDEEFVNIIQYGYDKTFIIG